MRFERSELLRRFEPTSLNVEDVVNFSDNDPAKVVKMSGVDDLDHVRDMFYVLWQEPNGVEVEWSDGDGGFATVRLYEMG